MISTNEIILLTRWLVVPVDQWLNQVLIDQPPVPRAMMAPFEHTAGSFVYMGGLGENRDDACVSTGTELVDDAEA